MNAKTRWLLPIISTALFLASTIVQATGYPPPPPPDLNSFSGRAFVVYVNALGIIETTLVDTRELPDIGGRLHEELATVDIPTLLRAELLHATTTGGETLGGAPDPDGAESEAEVAHVLLNLAGIPIEADIIRAMTRAECVDKPGKIRLSGDSEIQNLKIGGKSVVHVAPNQHTTLNVGLLKVEVVLDEQIKKAFTKNGFPGGEIKVNALRITVKGLLGVVKAKVIISSAKSDIICGLEPTDP